MTTWITKKNGRISRVRQIQGEQPPGPDWVKVPNDWGGGQEDKAEWFDADMRRIPDADLIASGVRSDKRGKWYSKTTPGETKQVYGLDEDPGEGWTRKAPLEGEAYQEWDESAGGWVVDAEAKEDAEKQQRISEKKSAIEDAERRIQRSLIAIQAGTATQEDQQYFSQISNEITSLRAELRTLLAA
jgi:hypothetical protein